MNGITIKLTADLDFEGASVDSIAAVSNSCFRGVFDGQGKTISNISMKNYGLFRYLDGAEIKNLTLENVSNTAPDSYASILAGEAMTDSVNQISDCRPVSYTHLAEIGFIIIEVQGNRSGGKVFCKVLLQILRDLLYKTFILPVDGQ